MVMLEQCFFICIFKTFLCTIYEVHFFANSVLSCSFSFWDEPQEPHFCWALPISGKTPFLFNQLLPRNKAESRYILFMRVKKILAVWLKITCRICHLGLPSIFILYFMCFAHGPQVNRETPVNMKETQVDQVFLVEILISSSVLERLAQNWPLGWRWGLENFKSWTSCSCSFWRFVIYTIEWDMRKLVFLMKKFLGSSMFLIITKLWKMVGDILYLETTK